MTDNLSKKERARRKQIYDRRYRERHRDRLLADGRAYARINKKVRDDYYKAHKKERNAYRKKYYQENRVVELARHREYYLEHWSRKIKDWRREAERSISEMAPGETRPFEVQYEASIFTQVGHRLGYDLTFYKFKEGYRVTFHGKKKRPGTQAD